MAGGVNRLEDERRNSQNPIDHSFSATKITIEYAKNSPPLIIKANPETQFIPLNRIHNHTPDPSGELLTRICDLYPLIEIEVCIPVSRMNNLEPRIPERPDQFWL